MHSSCKPVWILARTGSLAISYPTISLPAVVFNVII